MRFPVIDTLVFVGSEDDEEGVRQWLFEDPPRIIRSGSDPDGDRIFHAFRDEQLSLILDFPGLQRALRDAAPDHVRVETDGEQESKASEPDLAGLLDQVAHFLRSRQYAFLAIGIRYTGLGLSLMRRADDGLDLVVFLESRIWPEHESRARAVFESAGLTPREDYLANRGRVRILGGRVPPRADVLAEVCGRFVIEVFEMRSDDTLEYKLGDPPKRLP